MPLYLDTQVRKNLLQLEHEVEEDQVLGAACRIYHAGNRFAEIPCGQSYRRIKRALRAC